MKRLPAQEGRIQKSLERDIEQWRRGWKALVLPMLSFYTMYVFRLFFCLDTTHSFISYTTFFHELLHDLLYSDPPARSVGPEHHCTDKLHCTEETRKKTRIAMTFHLTNCRTHSVWNKTIISNNRWRWHFWKYIRLNSM